MAGPRLFRAWLLTLLVLVVEETSVAIFARGETSLWVWAVLVAEGALFAAPFIWYEPVHKKNAEVVGTVVSVLLAGIATIWAWSYAFPNLLYSKPIPKNLDSLVFVVAVTPFFFANDVLAFKAFPKVGRLPFDLFLAGFLVLLIRDLWRVPDFGQPGIVIEVVVTAGAAGSMYLLFATNIRRIRRKDRHHPAVATGKERIGDIS
jgi:hypothetical protein